MINVLALCAGVGGLELGIKLATGSATRVVCYVEREAYAAGVLAARMEDGALDTAPIWSNVRTFDARPWRGVVDIVTGGYPCQPFSNAGTRLGTDDPRHLWPDFARIIDECEPDLVFCENVGAHLRVGFDDVARDVQDLGYRVAATLHTASEHGAWHKRERLFWVAAADAEGERGQVRGASSEAVGRLAGGGATVSVADADGARLPQRQDGPQDMGEGERAATKRSRAQYHGWTAEPAVGRVADGMAYRVDRLRAAGNGVVPIVAANAFLELLRELQQ